MYFLILYCLTLIFAKLKLNLVAVFHNYNSLPQSSKNREYGYYIELFSKLFHRDTVPDQYLYGISTELKYNFKVNKYSFFYKLVSLFFISYKNNIGDNKFDNQTYIISSNTNVLTTFATQEKLRNLIIILLNKYSANTIICDAKNLYAIFIDKQNELNIRAIQDILFKIDNILKFNLKSLKEPCYKSIVYNDDKYNIFTISILFVALLYCIFLKVYCLINCSIQHLPICNLLEFNSCFRNGFILISITALLFSITSPYRHKFLFDFITIGIIIYTLIYHSSVTFLNPSTGNFICGLGNKEVFHLKTEK